jgi:hypothetical protein
MVFERCVFVRCRHDPRLGDVARALLAYDNPYDSVLAGSFFVETGRDATWTITVSTGHELFITGCWFSGSKEEEICPKNFALENCKFEMKQFPTIEVDPNAAVGQRQVDRNRGANGNLVVPAACGIAAVAACGIIWLQIELRKLCPEAGKIPRALL